MKKAMIPFDQLVPGWEADPPLNVRKTDQAADLDELAASLRSIGQFSPFVVKYQTVGKKTVPYVVDGGRRVLAWRSIMQADQSIDPTSPMECVVLDEGEDAQEFSLAASETPLPPHTADVVEMFASLHTSGKAPEEIAKRFGFTDIAVRRLLALGVLSPKILAAWRAGKIDVEAARAYTLAKDHETQERLLKKLGSSAWQIKRELGADGHNTARFLEFAGAEYEVAGGMVARDLFGEDHIVDDAPLLQKAVGDKIKLKADALLADGWGWACQRDELPPSMQYSVYPGRDAKGGKTPKAERGKYGCLLELQRDGKLVVEYGLEKPKARKDGRLAGKPKAKGDEPAPDISNALMLRLSETATLGMQDVFRKLPNVGVAALIAGAAVQGNGGAFAPSPLALTIRGYKPGVNADHPEEREDLGFEEVFRAALGATDEQLLRMVADVAARCLDLRVYNAGREPFHDKGEWSTAGLIASVVDDVDIIPAMLAHFDAADYFKSASKKVVLRAIEEKLGPEQARTAAKLKSAQLAEFALTNLPGWLPPELIPGAAREAAPKPEKPAKKAIAKDGLSRKPAKKTAKRSR